MSVLKVLYAGSIIANDTRNVFTCAEGKSSICTINVSNSTPGTDVTMSLKIDDVHMENQILIGDTYQSSGVIIDSGESVIITASGPVDVRIYGTEE